MPDSTVVAATAYVLGTFAPVVRAPAEGVADHVRERVKMRLDRTRLSAERKAGPRSLDPNDRVAVRALTEAAISDDIIVSEYLGGVLAASGPDDDDAVSVVATISRLSSRQLRLHYVIYRELRRLYLGEKCNLYNENEAVALGVTFPVEELASALDGWNNSDLGTLRQEGLVLRVSVTERERGKWLVSAAPCARGAELFLWGHGITEVPAESGPVLRAGASTMFEPRLEVAPIAEVPETPNAQGRSAAR